MTKRLISFLIALCLLIAIPLSARYKYNPFTRKLDYYEPVSGSDLGDLGDVTLTGLATGNVLYYNGTAWVNLATGANGEHLTLIAGVPAWAAISSTFVGLTDTPANYVGSGSYMVRVNAGATALVFGAESAIDHDGLTNYAANQHRVWENSIAQNIHIDNIPVASIDHGTLAGLVDKDHMLNGIGNPTGNVLFNMTSRQIKFNYTVPATADGAFELAVTGIFSGDVFHVHQHTGNPGATNLVVFEAEDSDVVPLTVTGVGTYDILSGAIAVNSAGAAGEVGVDFTSINSTFSTIAQSDAEGIAVSSDLRIGLDETLRAVYLLDSGDIGTDFGSTAYTHPTLVFVNADADGRAFISMANDTFTFTNITGNGFYFETDRFVDFLFTGGGGDITATNLVWFGTNGDGTAEFVNNSGTQTWFGIDPWINQTGTAAYNAFKIDVTETSTGSGTNELMTLQVASTDVFTIGNKGSLDLTMSDALSRVVITQSNAAGTENVPLIFIDDARTGATADEAIEAALVIDAEGAYGLYVADGTFEVAGSSNFMGPAGFNNVATVASDVPLAIGGSYASFFRWTLNGAQDDFLQLSFSDVANYTKMIFMLGENLAPSGMTDHANYEPPNIVFANTFGADANDYAGVVLGERTQTNVAVAHYFDFYTMTGSIDGSVDGTTTELAAIFRFGASGTAIPGSATTPGDVLFEGKIEVNGQAFFDGGAETINKFWAYDNAWVTWGTLTDWVSDWDNNGGGDDIFVWIKQNTGAGDTAAVWWSNLNPSGMTDHDDYLSPTFVLTNDEGADANDYAGVVIGERAQADVKVAHYFDFYAMTGAADGSVDPANAELAAIFRFGASGSAVPGSATTPGDVLFEGAIEVNGVAYFDGRVGTDLLPSSDGGFDLGDNTYAWQDIVLTATGAHYYGDTDTDTTWKIVRDGTKLSFLRRETGSYVEKGFFDTSFHAANIHLEEVGGISGALCWRPGTSPPAHDMGYRLWLDSSGDLWLLEQNANPETRVQNKIVREDENNIIHTSEIRARDAAGLKLYDDAGLGIFVADGGDVLFEGSIEVDGQAYFDADTNQYEDIFWTWGDAADHAVIGQSAVAGTSNQPLIYIDDDRTGATVDVMGEATLFIDAAGTYAFVVNTGETRFNQKVSFIEDLDVSWAHSYDKAEITQIALTGTEDQPLIFIDDDRTGVTTDEESEATIFIDSEGTYALVINDGDFVANGIAYFNGRIGADLLPSADGGSDLGDNTYAWQDIVLTSTGAFYYGDTDVDGTWKTVRDGTKLSFLRRETGSYVEKGYFDTASFHALNIYVGGIQLGAEGEMMTLANLHVEGVGGGEAGYYKFHEGTKPVENESGHSLIWVDGSGDFYLQDGIGTDVKIGMDGNFIRKDGTVPLTADWDIGDTFKILADEIRARDAAGLKLYDDGGIGIFVADGGDVLFDGAIEVDGQANFDADTNQYEDIFWTWGDAADHAVIGQSAVAGTSNQPLIYIDDDRTGATVDVMGEATLFIDAAGMYAFVVNTGESRFNQNISFTENLEASWTNAADKAVITQIAVAGTEDVPLIAITDARTGVTTDEEGEATIFIDSEGTYALVINDGDFVANGAVNITNKLTVSNILGGAAAIGYQSTAGQLGAVALGYQTDASGMYSTTMGAETTASNQAATAMGFQTTASGMYSFAMGREIEVSGNYSVAIALADMDGLNVTQANIMAIVGGRVSIGTHTPATDALLDLTSTTKALIITRMTTAQRDALTAVNGMVIYNTTTTAFNFYENGVWVTRYGFSSVISQTIVAGVITISSSYTEIVVEGGTGAGADDLDTINGGGAGQVIVIRTASSGPNDIVTAKDNTGNLRLSGDFAMNNIVDILTLIYDSGTSSWREISRSDN